ncbi:MAG TPA: c-type cytochrome domain-containing protein, partial [Dyadobacter sp.]|nr:c-type cytochrome domain-containing protein [Dyadobacter sp.]
MAKQILIASAIILISGIMFGSCYQKNTLKEGSTSDAISYNFDVRPILSDKCFACHGPDANKREAGLRLDVAESAFAKLKEGNGVAIFPGKPEQSELYKRIIS